MMVSLLGLCGVHHYPPGWPTWGADLKGARLLWWLFLLVEGRQTDRLQLGEVQRSTGGGGRIEDKWTCWHGDNISIIDETLGVDGNALVVILRSIIRWCDLFLSGYETGQISWLESYKCVFEAITFGKPLKTFPLWCILMFFWKSR